MARIDVRANITAPTEINIPLVRADHASTSHIFRVCFEVSLSVFSTLLGYMLGLKDPQPIHWVFISLCAISAASFLVLTARYGKTSKVV